MNTDTQNATKSPETQLKYWPKNGGVLIFIGYLLMIVWAGDNALRFLDRYNQVVDYNAQAATDHPFLSFLRPSLVQKSLWPSPETMMTYVWLPAIIGLALVIVGYLRGRQGPRILRRYRLIDAPIFMGTFVVVMHYIPRSLSDGVVGFIIFILNIAIALLPVILMRLVMDRPWYPLIVGDYCCPECKKPIAVVTSAAFEPGPQWVRSPFNFSSKLGNDLAPGRCEVCPWCNARLMDTGPQVIHMDEPKSMDWIAAGGK